MIGAIEFMKRWHDECKALTSCDYCRLRDKCKGSMARLTNSDIMDILTLVMSYGKGVYNESAIHKKSKS